MSRHSEVPAHGTRRNLGDPIRSGDLISDWISTAEGRDGKLWRQRFPEVFSRGVCGRRFLEVESPGAIGIDCQSWSAGTDKLVRADTCQKPRKFSAGPGFPGHLKPDW